jgi:hypothetical protein
MLQLLAYIVLTLSSPALCASSPKRGLIYIGNPKHLSDDSIWTRSGSDLTWYYNYAISPTSDLSGSSLQYVPQLWGDPPAPGAFYSTVKSLKDEGVNISYVLGFNEPDGPKKTGGSNISPSQAAQWWISEIEPLKGLGIQLGAPATQGNSAGISWLTNFLNNCKGGCTIDFLPVHWYGPFEGLASYVGQVYATFGNKSIWVTEFALPNASLQDSQAFYNQSTSFLDQLK